MSRPVGKDETFEEVLAHEGENLGNVGRDPSGEYSEPAGEGDRTPFDPDPSVFDAYTGMSHDDEGNLVLEFDRPEQPPEEGDGAAEDPDSGESRLPDELRQALDEATGALESDGDEQDKFKRWQQTTTQKFMELAELRKEVETLRAEKAKEEVSRQQLENSATEQAQMEQAAEQLVRAAQDNPEDSAALVRGLMQFAADVAERKARAAAAEKPPEVPEPVNRRLAAQEQMLEYLLEKDPGMEELIPYAQAASEIYRRGTVTEKEPQGRSLADDYGLAQVFKSAESLRKEHARGAGVPPAGTPRDGGAETPSTSRVVSKEELMRRASNNPLPQAGGSEVSPTEVIGGSLEQQLDRAIDASITEALGRF